MGCPLHVPSAETFSVARPTSLRLPSNSGSDYNLAGHVITGHNVTALEGGVKAAFRAVDYICHRGYRPQGVPENSFQSLQLAAMQGLVCEIDVRVTKDGMVVVFHDKNAIRMTGVDRRIDKAPYSELQDLLLARSRQQIPLLSEVLNSLPNLPLVLDAKERCELSVASVVERARATNRVLLLIRDTTVAGELIRKFPQLGLCISIGSNTRLLTLGERHSRRPTFLKVLLKNLASYLAVSFEIQAIDKDVVDALRDDGKLVLAYHTRTPFLHELCKNRGLIPVTDCYQ